MSNIIKFDTPTLKDGIYREINLLQFPITFPSHKIEKDRIEFSMTLSRGSQKYEMFYSVRWILSKGYPGPGIKTIMAGMEKIARKSSYPIMNPVRFSLYELSEACGFVKSGNTNDMLRKGLKLIHSMTITAKEAFFDNRDQVWTEVDDHIIDKIVWKGKKLPDGTIAETNYVFFSDWYINSMNSKYNFIIDEEYATSLMDIPLSNKLYELLCLSFYRNHLIGQEGLRVRYSFLCNFTQATRQNYKSKAEQVFNMAIKRLISSGFLESVVWEDMPIRNIDDDMKDWLITFWPGARAFEVIKANEKTGPEIPGKMIALESYEEGKEHPSPLPPPERQRAYDLLVENRVSKSVAKRLSETYDYALIEEYCVAIDYVNVKKNRAAYLAKMIENNDDWGLPEQYIIAKEQEEKKERKAKHSPIIHQATMDLISEDTESAEAETIINQAISAFAGMSIDDQTSKLIGAVSGSSSIPKKTKERVLENIEEIIRSLNDGARPSDISAPDWAFVEQVILTIIKPAQNIPEPVF